MTDTSAHEPPAMMPACSQCGARSLGILGGTFNPPHAGHLAMARDARVELGLERVLLMPAHTSPFKARGEDRRDRPGGADPGPAHRLAMCRLACAGEDGLDVSAAEVERGGLSYTVDTLRAIRAANANAELTLIVGADTAGTIGSWREPAELLALAHLAVAARAGTAQAQVLDAIGEVGGDDAQVRFLKMPHVDASSSLLRERVARGEPVAQLVGPDVAAYIAEHGLYRDRAQQAKARL